MSSKLISLPKPNWLLACTILVVLSFTINFIGAVDVYNFAGWQSDSEQLVKNSFTCQHQLGWQSQSGLLVRNITKNCTNGADIYYSQSGLPFWIIGRLDPSSPIPERLFIASVKLILAILSAAMLVMITRRLSSNLRIRYQVLIYFLLASSPWLVLVAHNLYWLTPLLLAPGWLGWVFYTRFSQRLTWFYLLLVGLFFIKFLAGYEYTSTLAISALCPVLYYELKKHSQPKLIIKRLVYPLLCAIVGFTLALAVNWGQASHQTGSAKSGLKVIYERVRIRSFASPDMDLGPYIVNQFYSLKPVDYAYFENTLHLTRHTGYSLGDKLMQRGIVAYQYAASPAVSLPINLRFPFTVFTSSIATFAFITILVIYIRINKFGKKFIYSDPLATTTLVAFIGSLSWLILGYQHSLIHTHVNSIMFYFPFLPLAYVLTARQLQNAGDLFRQKKKARAK